MALDRVTLAFLGLASLSAAAMAAYLVPAKSQTETAGKPATLSSAGSGEAKAGAEAGAAAWQAEECDVYQDVGDPRHIRADASGMRVKEVYDDQLTLEISKDEDGYFDELVSFCGAQAASAKDPAVAARFTYTTARIEILLNRLSEARMRLTPIADTYPAAAYRLAKMKKDEGANLLPDSREFMDLLHMFKRAHEGGDHRATAAYTEMVNQYFPAENYNLPGFAVALLNGKTDAIPDTIDTRIAASSFWEGMATQCSMFATWVVSPAQQRALDNSLVPVQVERWTQIFTQLPIWAGNIKEWVNDQNNYNLNSVLRGINTVKAAPGQIMFIMNQAANRDGREAARFLDCKGPRFERLFNSLAGMFEERENLTPGKVSALALESLSKPPEISTVIS